MARLWLIGVGSLWMMALAACSSSSESSSGNVQIVAADDGSVEVIAGGRAIFALAAEGPVARNFTERVVGVGAIVFERIG
ncbi:MAG: hypothetical protein WCB63_14070 [Polyangiales bacterium]